MTSHRGRVRRSTPSPQYNHRCHCFCYYLVPNPDGLRAVCQLTRANTLPFVVYKSKLCSLTPCVDPRITELFPSPSLFLPLFFLRGLNLWRPRDWSSNFWRSVPKKRASVGGRQQVALVAVAAGCDPQHSSRSEALPSALLCGEAFLFIRLVFPSLPTWKCTLTLIHHPSSQYIYRPKSQMRPLVTCLLLLLSIYFFVPFPVGVGAGAAVAEAHLRSHPAAG